MRFSLVNRNRLAWEREAGYSLILYMFGNSNKMGVKILDDKLQEQLLNGLIDGEESSFNALYKVYSRPLFMRVLQMTKNEEEAEELIQELFTKIWENRVQLPNVRSFQSYIFTIANNLVYNHFRKISHNKALVQKLLLESAEHYLDGQELIENKEVSAIFYKAVSQLSPQAKQVFTLCKLEGKSHKEVAELLDISMATVNFHMTVAVKSIREYILKNQDIAILLLSAYAISGMVR